MKTLKLLLSCLLLTVAVTSHASEYAVGDNLATAQFTDQFDSAQSVDNDTHWLLFTRSMAGAEIAQKALEGASKTQFVNAKLIYVADVSAMPSLILKFAAMPKMQDLGYPIALDKEGDLSKLYPVADDAAALIDLKQLQVTQIRYFDNSDALKQSLASLLK